jgi:hypothetical protein
MHGFPNNVARQFSVINQPSTRVLKKVIIETNLANLVSQKMEYPMI